MKAIFTTYAHIFNFTYTVKLIANVKLDIRIFLLGTQRKVCQTDEIAILTESFLRQWGDWQQYIKNPCPSSSPNTINYTGVTNHSGGYFIPERAELVENFITICCNERDKHCLIGYYVAGMDTNEGAEFLRENGIKCCDRRRFSEYRQQAFSKIEAALLLHLHTNGREVLAA